MCGWQVKLYDPSLVNTCHTCSALEMGDPPIIKCHTNVLFTYFILLVCQDRPEGILQSMVEGLLKQASFKPGVKLFLGCWFGLVLMALATSKSLQVEPGMGD